VRHRVLFLTAAVVMMVVSAGVSLADDRAEAKAEAVNAANAWLALLDAGDYGASWDGAADYLKRAISKEDWQRTVAAVRQPLGAVTEREVEAASYRTELPGAPDGHYVVIQFSTRFANKRSAVETVTPTLEEDGQWRVSGYFVR
jgi:hypothetical protein